MKKKNKARFQGCMNNCRDYLCRSHKSLVKNQYRNSEAFPKGRNNLLVQVITKPLLLRSNIIVAANIHTPVYIDDLVFHLPCFIDIKLFFY